MKKLVFAILAAGVTFAGAANLLEDTLKLGLQAYQKGNYANAATHFQKACDSGNPAACEKLGEMHAAGKGVAKNAANSEKFYEKACKNGMSKHCKTTQKSQNKGKTEPKNEAKQAGAQKPAQKSVRDAAKEVANTHANRCNAGSASSCVNAAKAEPAKSKEFYQKACKLGDKASCAMGK